MSDQQRPALAVVGWELLRLGAFAFGGLGATLALLQRGLVDRRGWLRQEDISEALAITQALPGSTGIQVVSYLGWRLRGWPGALAGIQVGVVGLIIAAMWRLARNQAKTAMLAAVLLTSCVVGFFVHAVLIVVGAGLLGALLSKEKSDG